MKKFAAFALIVGLFALDARADLVGEGITPTSAPPSADSAPSSGKHSLGLMFESAYGFSSVSPLGMNSALNDFQWPGSVNAPGPINDLQYLAVGVGYKIKNWAYVVIRYEQSQQSMLPVVISPTTYSVTNSFLYYPIYLLADVPVYHYGSFYVSGIAGVGYALKYELHQTENPGEDVTWKANPIVYRVGTNVGFSFADNFDLFADIFYEMVTSKLKAESSYATTFNGTAITQGQYFADENSGAIINVNMSGLRYGLGVRLRF
jgi:hypothetical protein